MVEKKTKLMLYSTQVEIEVGVELGNIQIKHLEFRTSIEDFKDFNCSLQRL